MNLRVFLFLTVALGVGVSGCDTSPPPDNIGSQDFTRQMNASLGGGYPPFQVASQGCSMSHCDAQNTDLHNMEVPTDPNVQIVHTVEYGNEYLVPSSNGTHVVVSANGGPNENLPELEYYDYYGNQLWCFHGFNRSAAMSMPMIGANGEVIHADNERLIRFAANGDIMWESPMPGGREDSMPNSDFVSKFWAARTALPGGPVSTGFTQSGYIFMATLAGPVVAFKDTTGQQVGPAFYLTDGPADPYFYDSLNTPGVSAVYPDRVYIVTQRNELGIVQDYGRFYALDIKETGIEIAWYLPIDAASGASPTVVGDRIYTDGGTNSYGFKDHGDYGEQLWATDFEGENEISFALDPRGGLWNYSINWAQTDRLLRLNEDTGLTDEVMDTSEAWGFNRRGFAAPTSILNIGLKPGSGDPILLAGFTVLHPTEGGNHMAAIDLADNNRILWKVKTGRNYQSYNWGQSAIVSNGSNKRVVIIGNKTGIKWLGNDPQ